MKEINLSIIVPAYNEEKRIPAFLNELLDYSIKYLTNYEILIVNDGSTDNTKSVVGNLIQNHGKAKLISYQKNKGKGHAIYQGILKSKGNFVIFIDADGSIQPKEIGKMLKIYRKVKPNIIIGSRLLNKSNIIRPQPINRRYISKIFNIYSNLLFNLKIKDLLCGFKGFEREAAFQIFKDLKSYRWDFDVEILYKAKRKRYTIFILPIEWEHKEGSKIKRSDPLSVFLNLLVLRLRFF